MRLPQIGDSCRRRSDQKLYIISADRYGKGARYVELEPESDGECFWIADFLFEWEFDFMTKFGDIEITQRGFGVIKFKDAYGCECSIQESSANGPYLWLGPSEADPKILASQASKHGVETDETTGWVPYPIPEEVLLTTRMHLHKEHVIELVKVLQQWLETEDLKTSV